MPRNMSFSLTTDQIRNRSKTVTRRLGWKNLKPGEIINACVKCMGLQPGEKIERLCQIRVTNVWQEPLFAMLQDRCFSSKDGARCSKRSGHNGDHYSLYPTGGWGEDHPPLLPDSRGESTLEGFPELTNSQFVEMFCKHMKCKSTQIVTRIEFEYVD